MPTKEGKLPITKERFELIDAGSLIIDAMGVIIPVTVVSGDQYNSVYVNNPHINMLRFQKEEIVDENSMPVADINHPNAILIQKEGIVDEKFRLMADINHPNVILILVSKNQKHPERRDGEIVLTMGSPEEARRCCLHFSNLRIECYSNPKNGFVSVFLPEEDYKRALK